MLKTRRRNKRKHPKAEGDPGRTSPTLPLLCLMRPSRCASRGRDQKLTNHSLTTNQCHTSNDCLRERKGMMSSNQRSMTIEDLYQFKFLGKPRISPDRQRVAFAVTTIDESKHEYPRLAQRAAPFYELAPESASWGHPIESKRARYPLPMMMAC